MRPSCVPFLSPSGSLKFRMSPQRSRVDGGDLHLGVLLTVTLALLVTGLVLVLLDDDLRALGATEDLSGDGGLVQTRRGYLLAVHEHDDREGHRRALVAGDEVDLDDVADGNLLLLAASLHDRVHRGLLCLFQRLVCSTAI